MRYSDMKRLGAHGREDAKPKTATGLRLDKPARDRKLFQGYKYERSAEAFNGGFQDL